VVVDPRENVGEVGFGVEARQLRGLDDGHCVGEGFAAGVRAGKKPVLPADRDGADGALGGIVVDGNLPDGDASLPDPFNSIVEGNRLV